MLMNYFFIVFAGLYMFSSKRKHLLITLLSLEFMVLGMFSVMFILMSFSHLFFSLVYLVFAACEGALGISILVGMSRSYGSDYFSVFNI